MHFMLTPAVLDKGLMYIRIKKLKELIGGTKVKLTELFKINVVSQIVNFNSNILN